MDVETEITALTVLSAATFLGGLLLILFFGATLTLVGLVLMSASTVVFIVDVMDVLSHWRRLSGE